MNILYIASVRIPNEKASGLAIMRQCEAFAELGHQVALLRPYRINHIAEDPFAYYGISPSFRIETMGSINFIERLGVLGFFITRVSQMIASFLYWFKSRRDIDVVYARDPWMLPVILLFPSAKRRVIWEAHQAQKGVIVRYVAKHSDKVVCISQGLREYFGHLSGRSDILLEPSGVHLKQFENISPREKVRKKFNLPSKSKILGYIGKYKTMGEEKGVDDLIYSFARVRLEQPNVHLLIVGLEPAEEVAVRSVCVKAGLPEGGFTLLPLVQRDFAEYIQASDILIMNYPDTDHYRNYMSPTKLFAYMAGKRIVVSTNLSSVRQIIGDMAIFVDPGSQDSLVQGLSRAIQKKDVEQLLEKARAEVEKYSWTNRGARILKTLSENA